MNKFKPHKGCSCKMCKGGKTPKHTRPIERKFRHDSKIELIKDGIEFSNKKLGGFYYD